MDDLDDREAFLRAVFADPDNDLPRLVFADWLDERGESAWAELIRLQCELARATPARDPKLVARVNVLISQLWLTSENGKQPYRAARGFQPASDGIETNAALLGEAAKFRELAVRRHPEWYGCTRLKVSGLIAGGKPIQTILTSPVTERVTELDLSGSTVSVHRDAAPSEDSYGLLDEYEYRPTVTVQAVLALVDAREARRLTHLDLRNNDLDNDAARAIVRSTNLIRLTSLQLGDGNQFRGRTWQQLLERFGPDVLK